MNKIKNFFESIKNKKILLKNTLIKLLRFVYIRSFMKKYSFKSRDKKAIGADSIHKKRKMCK